MFNYDESTLVEKEIAVSAERLWDIISLPGGLTLLHPFMEKHTVESWNGVGSRDHVTYYSGLEYDREVVRWIEGTGFDLKVTENGKHEITVIFRITPIDGQRCVLGNIITIGLHQEVSLPYPLGLAQVQNETCFCTIPSPSSERLGVLCGNGSASYTQSIWSSSNYVARSIE